MSDKTTTAEPAQTNRLAEQLANPKVTNGILAMSNQKFRIPGDVIAKTCENLPDSQRQAIKWAAGYCHQRNLSLEEFGALLRQKNGSPYSADSVYAVFTGRRDASSVENFCAAVETLRRRIEETRPRLGQFIETSLTRKVFQVCRRAFERKKLTFIFGPSQIGKSTGLDAYAQQHNHGETYLIRMPTRGSLGDFLEELAIRTNIPAQNRHHQLRRRIMECFDDRTLLIVDECHQCFMSHYSDRALASLEFCREIWDRRKCGMVLCGTNVFRDQLKTNRVLRQLWLRGYSPLQLPSEPTEANLSDFAKGFGLPPAEDKTLNVEWIACDDDGRELPPKRVSGNPLKLQQSVIKDHGLGRWLSILEDASDVAKEERGRVTWGRVIIAYRNWQAMESGKAD